MGRLRLGYSAFGLCLVFIFAASAAAQNGSLSLANSPMHVARSYQSAILLANGTVLIFGGEQTDAQVESFALPAGTFSQAGTMLTPRTHQTATLLLNGCPPTMTSGCVLITGGLDENGNVLSSAELYDPNTGTSQSVPGGMNSPRYDHRATLLKDGTVLITGGVDSNGNTLNSAEIFDPNTNQFRLTGNMQYPRTLHTATLLNNGQVLIAGGASYSTHQACSAVSSNDCGSTTWTGGEPSAELYDPGSQQFIPTGSMSVGRWGHTATLLSSSGQVLILGGGQQYELHAYGSQGAPQGTWIVNSTAEIYDPTTGQFYPAGSLSTGRLGHTATVLPSGIVLVAGGEYDGVQYNPFPYFTTTVLSSTELFNPASRTSVPGPSLSTGRSRLTATTLPNGAVLFDGGGSSSADLYWPAGVPVTVGLNRMAEFDLAWGYMWNGYSGGPCNSDWATSGVTFPNNFNLDQIRVPNHNNGYAGHLYVYQDSTSNLYATSSSANINYGDGVATFFFSDPVILAGHTYYFDGDHVGPPGNDFTTGGYLNCGPSLWTFYAQAAPLAGIITVTTNIPSSAFTISGPTTLSGSGTTGTFADVPPGSYTITFEPAAGYITPSPQTETLAAGGKVAFSGIYTPIILQMSQTTVLFKEQKNQPVQPQQVTVTTNGPPVNFSASVAGPVGQWLSVSPSSGTTPATLTVSIISGLKSLAPASYIGEISITSAGVTNSPQTIAIGLDVITGALPATSSWTKLAGPWSKDCDGSFGAIAVDPVNRNIIYIGSSRRDNPCGIFKTTDGGQTWSAMNNGFPRPIVLLGQYESVSKIVISPSDHRTVYVGTEYLDAGGSVFRSDNGGGKWEEVRGQSSPTINAPVLDLSVNPSNSSEVVVGASKAGIFTSENGGDTWSLIRGGTLVEGATDNYNVVRFAQSACSRSTRPRRVPRERTSRRRGASHSAISRACSSTPAIIYGAGFNTSTVSIFSGTTPFPPFELMGPNYTYESLSYLTALPDGVTPVITDIAVDPTNANTLYASTIAYDLFSVIATPVPNMGVFKSQDGGSTWQAVNGPRYADLSQFPIYQLLMDPNEPGTLFADTGTSGIFVTITGGQQWQQLPMEGLPTGTKVDAIGLGKNGALYALTANGVFMLANW